MSNANTSSSAEEKLQALLSRVWDGLLAAEEAGKLPTEVHLGPKAIDILYAGLSSRYEGKVVWTNASGSGLRVKVATGDKLLVV